MYASIVHEWSIEYCAIWVQNNDLSKYGVGAIKYQLQENMVKGGDEISGK